MGELGFSRSTQQHIVRTVESGISCSGTTTLESDVSRPVGSFNLLAMFVHFSGVKHYFSNRFLTGFPPLCQQLLGLWSTTIDVMWVGVSRCGLGLGLGLGTGLGIGLAFGTRLWDSPWDSPLGLGIGLGFGTHTGTLCGTLIGTRVGTRVGTCCVCCNLVWNTVWVSVFIEVMGLRTRCGTRVGTPGTWVARMRVGTRYGTRMFPLPFGWKLQQTCESCWSGPADCIDDFALNAALHAAMLDVFSTFTSFKFSTGSCDSSVSSRRGFPSLSTITFGVCLLTVADTSSLTGGLLDIVSVSSSLLLIRSITLLLILPTFKKSKHFIRIDSI